jgi:hypothetical protein
VRARVCVCVCVYVCVRVCACVCVCVRETVEGYHKTEWMRSSPLLRGRQEHTNTLTHSQCRLQPIHVVLFS